MKIKKLTQSEINKIINLYTSGNVSSTHKLAKIFSVGHKKISDVLKSNGIEINKKGGQKKYGDIIITQNVVNKNLLENGKKINLLVRYLMIIQINRAYYLHILNK
jgi:ssRNA-specific RNase YbeY (16S rRNA maturation enzyme)